MTWTNRLKLWGGILLVAAITFALTLLFNQRQSQVASFTATVDAPVAMVGSSYGGVVTDLRVRPGDAVTAGDPLFTLSSLQLQQGVSHGLNPLSTEAYTIDAESGTITYHAVSNGYVASIDARPGTFLPSGSPMALVVADGERTVTAQFELEPSEYGRVEQGASTRVVLPNNQTVQGTVAGVTVKTNDQGNAITFVTIDSPALTDPALSSLTRLGTPVTVIMDLRDDGWLAGPTEELLAFLTKIGLR